MLLVFVKINCTNEILNNLEGDSEEVLKQKIYPNLLDIVKLTFEDVSGLLANIVFKMQVQL